MAHTKAYAFIAAISNPGGGGLDVTANYWGLDDTNTVVIGGATATVTFDYGATGPEIAAALVAEMQTQQADPWLDVTFVTGSGQ